MVRQLVTRIDTERDASGVVYGTIVTAATIVGAAEGIRDVGKIAETVAVTLLLYWIAHAYAQVLAGTGGRIPSWTAAGHELAAESPMLAACFLPVVAMVTATLLGASVDLAASIAVWVAVAALFIWGLLIAHRVHLSFGLQLLSGLVYGLLGVAIVMLRVILVH